MKGWCKKTIANSYVPIKFIGVYMKDVAKGLFLGACFMLPVVLWAFGLIGR